MMPKKVTIAEQLERKVKKLELIQQRLDALEAEIRELAEERNQNLAEQISKMANEKKDLTQYLEIGSNNDGFPKE
jgi:septal ring factor EnvC (AmiA/AmiB activator)